MLSKSQQATFEAMVHEVAERVRDKEFLNTLALRDSAGVLLYDEPSSKAFKRGGEDQPLLLCAYSGNA